MIFLISGSSHTGKTLLALINEEYDLDVDMNSVLKSERLVFKKIKMDDFNELCKMLKDLEVMYAWEHCFTDEEVKQWIEKRNNAYKSIGYDYLLAIDKETKEVVGQIGLLDEVVNGKHFIGLGYILKKEFWHKGFALEGAKAMLEYAFNILKKEEVIATIRVENKGSCAVAEKLRMKIIDKFIKVYKGKDMIHLVYSISKEEWKKIKVKNDASVEVEFMTLLERDREKIEEGREEGREEGIKLTKKVFKLLTKGKKVEDIAKECNISIEEVEKILE